MNHLSITLVVIIQKISVLSVELKKVHGMYNCFSSRVRMALNMVRFNFFLYIYIHIHIIFIYIIYRSYACNTL